MLTLERLREVLDYSPEDGLFIWKLKVADKVTVGDEAGSISKQRGYIFIGVDGKHYRAHRLAFFYMTGQWPKEQVDHINGVRTDNRWGNLREATASQNQANRSHTRLNKSGFKGVAEHTENKGRWVAYICHHRKTINLGSFESPKEAHLAYKEAAMKLHGPYHRAQ